MSAEATRLESLLLLVRDGRSSQIRDNAAEKLGQVAARSPACCASIVQQLRPLVIDPEWDIRVAATSEAQPPNNKGLVETTARKQAIEMLSFSQRFKRRPVNDIVKDTREKRTKMDLGTGSYDVAMEVENSSCGRIGGAEMQTKAIIVANLVSDLFESMFDSKWEVRHGALLSLRQILLSCHLTAAIEALRPAMQDSEQHTCVNNWVEECLIRCICVLALDQFVDYSADESISPVREVCAQVFGVLLGSLSSKETLIEYLQVVRTLFSRSTWQACHGGLLGLKYLIRAHSNHGEALVPLVFNDIAMAFSRSSFEEDVLVLAADMLKEFAAYLDRVDSATVIKTALLLWRSLKLHDGAGLVKASIVQALSAWYSYVPVATLLQNDKAVKAAIWQHLSYTVPMLHHHSQFVRTSSATCAAAILSGEFASFKLRSIGFSRAFLPHLLFQMLLEDDETIQQSLLLAWKRAASSLSKGALLMDVLAENLPVWTKLLWCPADIKSLNVKVVHSDGTTTDVDVSSSTDRVAKQNVSSRVIFADAIGFAVAHVPLSHSCMTELVQLFRDGLCCSSGERQCGTLLALLKWGCSEKQLHCDNMNEQSQRLDHLQASVGHVVETFAADQWRQPPSNTISTSPFYSEQLRSLQRIFQMETRIIEIFFAAGITLKPSQKLAFGSTANISRHIAEHVALFPYHKLQSHPNEFEIAHFKRQDVFLVDELIQEQFSRFYHRVQGLGSSAYLELLPIPKKSGFLIKALMDSIKEEKEPVFRSISSRTVADFVVSQAGTQKKCVEKIVSNLCSSATALVGLRTIDDDDMSEDKELQKESSHSLAPDLVKKTKVRVDGAACALRELCKCGGASLFQTLAAMVAIVATRKSKDEEMPCLVVCPPIVISHWIQETKRYIPGFFASIIDYSRPASERKALNNGHGIPISEQGPTLILTTYSILRADIQSLASVSYAYVVLDEAHLIRNPTTAVFQAVRKLRASHRIALSGTPLQNNVTDLWALFEFLMPGYLGDFARFRREYTLPITKSKERNATTKQKEVAAIAIARLHQKVLPFLLRRTKDQVLKELPPKIISNILLPLSSLQRRLYVLASSRESIRTSTAAKRGDEHGETKPLTNVLTNLQLLRKICVHPALAVDDAISRALSATEKKALLSWKCSGKLTGLRDLLVECCDVAAWTRGASRVAASDTDDFDDTNFSPHRCLVFAHLQQTLNLTEQMLKDALPGVTYRRLDGQTPPSKRTDIVQRFNADPSIDVLLLTTAVGGLGLTLTGADTVIFIEHSWNPFVDLQAMDRAHRIGQKRTVRVFRLIMEETLEEHILNLQEFKEQVASTVVQKIDASTGMSSNTKDILNLLQVSSSAIVAKELRGTVAQDKVESGDPAAAAFPQTAQRLLDEIGELWNESQYESLAFPEAADK
ncbi:hypothetical protein PsorP6_014379 [Peronosclerospora sorghi]|uniref:Uncharacterized protein n=1 Tax=Peronosclerospora sorghi TaxID=230839 RepID=A0ACC0VHZ0_9STRA|nr:hypothetical protein PsorP6_014379 [Peronosclerospora sorghi]